MDMDQVFGYIRSKVGSIGLVANATDQVRQKCRMSMQGIGGLKCVLVNIDQVFRDRPSQKKCDFVLFLENSSGRLLVVPIELKNTRVEPSDVCAQLQVGASYAAQVVPQGIECICVPVVIHGKKIHSTQRDSLNKKKVMFRKNKLTIKTGKCNLPRNLYNAISASI